MTAMLASLLQLLYALTLLIVGGIGVFWTEWELRAIYGLDPATIADAATFLGQYRFLKAVEFGFGLFALLLRRDILGGGVETLIFLAGVLAGIVARLTAILADGAPQAVFLALLLGEILTFAFVWLHTSRDTGPS